jgi:hypothetical protein
MGGWIELEVNTNTYKKKKEKEKKDFQNIILKFSKIGLVYLKSIPIIYEMIPRAIVTVFFSHDDGQNLASSSLDVEVHNKIETKVSFSKFNLSNKTKNK